MARCAPERKPDCSLSCCTRLAHLFWGWIRSVSLSSGTMAGGGSTLGEPSPHDTHLRDVYDADCYLAHDPRVHKLHAPWQQRAYPYFQEW